MGKFMKSLEDTFVEVAFAEANVELEPGRKKMKKTRRGQRDKRSIGEWIEDASVASVYASAGDHASAVQFAAGDHAQESKQDTTPLILVVGGKDSFSDHLMNYAVDMAARISGAILALTVNGRADAQPAAAFAKTCEDRGVTFTHQMRDGNKDGIVEELSTEHPNLQYVMSEPPRPSVKSIPVFRPAPRAGAARARVNM